ncbi:Protein kinase domain-containing protein [Chitinophaga costaii]|uniref:Protein kinase domain-containing protein n=1 Tax=Chitinophaga costaii TaxID=1335309 RepID=A0A1C3YQJ4_9BACT|nr:hypothetical protein [Chitinophaga costaii]PUZ30056.1 hypothetical protein DCM91_00825 [Chitinophaga costaii]SCB72364.1 Protein kinase domain-containing protein [Chitinophaga costaii]
MELSYLPTFDSYFMYIEQAGIDVKEEGDWLMYGEPNLVSQWVLYYSLHPKFTKPFLDAFLSFAKENNLVFRLIKNDLLCYKLHSGNLGFSEVGKFLTVFCKNIEELKQVTVFLNNLNFRVGPAVPGSLRIGSNLYTNYLTIKRKNGGISAAYSLPKWKRFPIDVAGRQRPKQRRIWGRYYIPVKLLRPGPKGDIVLALSLKKWAFDPVVIKQGRHGVIEDQQFRDIRDRLRWQAEVIQDLSSKVPTAKYLDIFEQDGNAFLVLEYLNGKYLPEVINEIRSGEPWQNLPAIKKIQLLDLYLKCLRIAISIHEAGYIHRDLQDNNFHVHGNNVFILDMELCWSMKTRKPSPAFPLGTFGYAAPEQLRMEIPNGTEDAYSMAALLEFVVAFVHPHIFFSDEKKTVDEKLQAMELPADIVSTIVVAIYERPRYRPQLQEMEQVVIAYRNELLTFK